MFVVKILISSGLYYLKVASGLIINYVVIIASVVDKLDETTVMTSVQLSVVNVYMVFIFCRSVIGDFLGWILVRLKIKLKLYSCESRLISLVKETLWEMQFNTCEMVNGDGFIRLRERALVEAQGAHTICLCSRLLFWSKCTGFTVCLTYTDISYINQW